MKNNSTFMRIPQILACWMLMLLCGLPAHAGSWVLKEYRVEKYVKNQRVTATPDGQIRNIVTGFDWSTSNSPKVIKEVVPAQWPQGGNSLIQFYANLSHYSDSRDKPLPAGEAIYRLAVTPVFEWTGGPDETPTAELFYGELCRVEVSRSHAAPGGTYGFGDFQSPYNGSLTTYEQTNSWGQPLSDTDHTTPHGGVIRSADLQFDMCWTWKYERIKATGTVTHGKTRNFSGKVRTASFMPTNNSYGASASIGVVYEARTESFSLDVSTAEIARLKNDPREKQLNAYASRNWTFQLPAGQSYEDYWPQAIDQASKFFWDGAANYSVNMSPGLKSSYGDGNYTWGLGGKWQGSDIYSWSRDNAMPPSLLYPNLSQEELDQRTLDTSTSSKSIHHDLGDNNGGSHDFGSQARTTQTRVLVQGGPASDAPTISAKAKINWYGAPYTTYRAEVVTEVYDYNTGQYTELDSVMSGGNALETEEERTLDEFTTDYEAMKTEFVSTGAQLVGSALEAEMMVGSWFVPDEVDVATAGLTLAGKPLKQLYKVGKTLRATVEVANRINRVRDKLAGAVPAIRKKLGHSNFVIVMKRKKYRVKREGHIGPNGQREPAPMGELKEEEDILCNIPGGACFVKGTLVSTESGLRAIETLNAKDLVWSRDAATGTTQLKPIAQTFERYSTTLALTFSNGETVETTREHPFYVLNRGFVKAGELGIGTSIVTRAGPSVRVTSVEAGEAQTVYNFEVADYHTYFVGQGEVWVHNADYATVKAGRWMSRSEYEAMVETGKMQATTSGMEMKHVSSPPDPNSFRAASTGSVFVEFDVPTNQITQGGKEGWSIVFGPDSIYGRLAAKNGICLSPGMPPVTNIRLVEEIL